MIDPLDRAAAAALWEFGQTDAPGPFFLEKTVQFLVDIAVELLLHPVLLVLVLFPSGIRLAVAVIAAGSFSKPAFSIPHREAVVPH